MREYSDAYHYRPPYAPSFLAKVGAKQRATASEVARKKRSEEAELKKLEADRQRAKEAYLRIEREVVVRAANRAAMKARFGVDSPTIDEIVNRICKFTGIPRKLIISRRRNAKLMLVRQAIYYWCYRVTPCSLPEIGKHLGGRDHTTILHGVDAYVRKRAAQGRTLRQARP